MAIPTIKIEGSKGKTIVCKYIEYILTQIFKLNAIFIDESNLHILDEDINFDVVITKRNIVHKKFKTILTGFNIIDYDSLMNTLPDTTYDLLNKSPTFLRRNIPLVITNQNEEIFKVMEFVTNDNNVPLFVSQIYHLNYINLNTNFTSKYNKVNISLALTICQLFKQLNKNNYIFNEKLFKLVDVYGKKTFHCPHLSPIPNLKALDLGNCYTKLKTYENLKFYFDSGGSFKGSVLAVEWFESYIKSLPIKNNILICIFNIDPQADLVKTLVPLTAVNFATFFIANQNLKGDTFDKIVQSISINKENFNVMEEPVDWIETIYNTVSYIYNDSSFINPRKFFNNELKESFGFHENFDNPKLRKLPEDIPNFITDDPRSILTHILKNRSMDNTYHILCTGYKPLINDINEILNSL